MLRKRREQSKTETSEQKKDKERKRQRQPITEHSKLEKAKLGLSQSEMFDYSGT
jgi:hypothetical protein